MAHEAIEPFVRLRQRIADVLGKHGLMVTDMLFSPDDPIEVHVRTRLVDAPIDDRFEEVIASAQVAETERRAEESRKALEQEMNEWLEN